MVAMKRVCGQTAAAHLRRETYFDCEKEQPSATHHTWQMTTPFQRPRPSTRRQVQPLVRWLPISRFLDWTILLEGCEWLRDHTCHIEQGSVYPSVRKRLFPMGRESRRARG
jgi:hypothetical protein